MPACPFYGFHWPERSPTLEYVGGNECGLDLDQHGPCKMGKEGRLPDYYSCPLVDAARHRLHSAKRLIYFQAGGTAHTLDEWEEDARRIA